MEGIITFYNYGKEIVMVILIPLGVMVWKLRGEVSKLITKDDIAKYTSRDDVDDIVDSKLKGFVCESLELETKYVSYDKCKVYRSELSSRMHDTTESVAKEFSKALHEVTAMTKELGLEMKIISKQLSELAGNIAIQQAEYKKDMQHKEELRKAELEALRNITIALSDMDNRCDIMAKQLNEHEGYFKAIIK